MSATHAPFTILVVDDDPGLTRLIECELRREGYRTAAAGSGHQANAWLREHRADLLLLDLKLPDMEGPALIESMTSAGHPPPFIIITGQGDERVAVDMMKRGALDYLVKDVSFIEFVPTVVRRALSQLDKEHRLAAAEADRLRLQQEILHISEQEQQRIGRDLHDDLGQQLAGLSIMATMLSRSLASRAAPEVSEAARISELLKKAVSMTRSLARGLHPVVAEPDGLVSALHDLAARMTSLFQIDCEFEAVGPAQMNDNAAATHLYRIAQEAVSNGVKHGRAKHVHLGLCSDAETLTLTIRDDGGGIGTLDPQLQGMGLRIMHYRAGIIGATLAIEGRRSGGTCVTCTLPRHQARGASCKTERAPLAGSSISGMASVLCQSGASQGKPAHDLSRRLRRQLPLARCRSLHGMSSSASSFAPMRHEPARRLLQLETEPEINDHLLPHAQPTQASDHPCGG